MNEDRFPANFYPLRVLIRHVSTNSQGLGQSLPKEIFGGRDLELCEDQGVQSTVGLLLKYIPTPFPNSLTFYLYSI